jgi:hypothetical protein
MAVVRVVPVLIIACSGHLIGSVVGKTVVAVASNIAFNVVAVVGSMRTAHSGQYFVAFVNNELIRCLTPF